MSRGPGMPGAPTEGGGTYPAYLAALRSGELRRRAEAAARGLSRCRLCPRACGADRLAGKTGSCRTGRTAVVSSAFPHFGEEAPLSGTSGSGTIFFSGCNLGCGFCQNWDISHGPGGREAGAGELARLALSLQEFGCHNLNLVTPTHVVPQVLEGLALAAEAGLRLPVVYNTGGYDSLETLRLLDGLVDIYMPDFKLWSPGHCKDLLAAPDYGERAREAVQEMHRQAGTLQVDPATGLATRGVLIRHLVMPGLLEETRSILCWISRTLGPDSYVNLMAQYRPAGAALSGELGPALGGPLSRRDYRRALAIAAEAGLRRLDGRQALVEG